MGTVILSDGYTYDYFALRMRQHQTCSPLSTRKHTSMPIAKFSGTSSSNPLSSTSTPIRIFPMSCATSVAWTYTNDSSFWTSSNRSVRDTPWPSVAVSRLKSGDRRRMIRRCRVDVVAAEMTEAMGCGVERSSNLATRRAASKEFVDMSERS